MNTRPPIARMAFIRKALVDRRLGRCSEPVTTDALATKLEVTRKTVLRDLDFMRDRLGYEIEWTMKPQESTWRLTRLPKPIL